MLIVTRRLILSSFLFLTFLGTGVLFGSSPENVANFVETSGNNTENPVIGLAVDSRRAANPSLRWLFFSFAQKGAR